MTENARGLSLIIPVYNEQGCIAETLREVERVFCQVDFDWEIIVVDDCSCDGTADVLRGSALDRTRVLSHEVNRGYGAAILTGMRRAKYSHIAITDADGTYPHKLIPMMYKRLLEEDLDMLVGSRTGSNVKYPLSRKPAKWILGKLANYVAKRKIPDINSGQRVFDKELALKFDQLYPPGFSFTTTITLALICNGFRVGYMPIDYFARIGRSKIRPIHDTLNFLQLILRISLYFNPLQLFLPAALSLVGLGIGWGFFSWFVLGKLAEASTLVIVLSGVQLFSVGLLAELINHRTRYNY